MILVQSTDIGRETSCHISGVDQQLNMQKQKQKLSKELY